jgi:hypothetical protein
MSKNGFLFYQDNCQGFFGAPRIYRNNQVGKQKVYEDTERRLAAKHRECCCSDMQIETYLLM